MMLMRTAKSCGSDAPGLASSLREDAQATVATKPGHRGDHEVRRKTIARGMPGDFRCDRGDYARVLCFFRTRGCGCIGHPAFPAPSVFLGANRSCKTSGASRREIAEVYPPGCLKIKSGKLNEAVAALTLPLQGPSR